ncbi:hypothetical protein AAF712_015154 [Marasmius tenuissimus]|uniref:Uncharacterized protein n=1 Tax=Marasmius tenuissimus TaxID=585030 RepID=A0ABR2ZAC5_9AGAR
MSCGRCGKEPECLIWDGVTLGFGRKHLTDSLRPPTYTDDKSPQRQRRYAQKPQLLPDEAQLQRLLRHWVKCTSTDRTTKKGGKEGGNNAWTILEDFKTIVGQLVDISAELVTLFQKNLGPQTELSPSLRRAYAVFFEQVRGNNPGRSGKRAINHPIQVAAEESALQMINAKSLPLLEEFLQQPNRQRASRLVDIPAVSTILEAEFQTNGRYSNEMVDVLKWMVN